MILVCRCQRLSLHRLREMESGNRVTVAPAGIEYEVSGESMKKILAFGAAVTFALAVPALIRAQEGGNKPAPRLLVPGYDAARDVPGAAELPDPKIDYKVLFSVS